MANSGAPQGRGMASFSSCSVASLLPLLLLAIAAFISPSQALVYNVGDRSWTLPPTMNYNFWAASKQFRVNDILSKCYMCTFLAIASCRRRYELMIRVRAHCFCLMKEMASTMHTQTLKIHFRPA